MTPPFDAPVQPTPEPDTGGQVEALARELYEAEKKTYPGLQPWEMAYPREFPHLTDGGFSAGRRRVCQKRAEQILATVWLTERLTEARAEARGVALWEAGAQVGAKRSNPGESADYRRGFKEAIDWAFDSVQSLPRAASISETAHAARTVPLQDAEPTVTDVFVARLQDAEEVGE